MIEANKRSDVVGSVEGDGDLSSQASTARERELPAILERLDRALAPHRRERLRVG